MTAREQIQTALETFWNWKPNDPQGRPARLLDEFAHELAAANKAEPYGLSVEWPNARAYLLQLMAQWGLKTRDGSREIADKILQLHAHELAERLRNVHITGEGEQWNWWDAATIPESCAALIDPEAQQ